MKIAELLKSLNETTTSAITVAPVAVGGMQKRNPDGTAKNAQDMNVNLLGSKKRKRKSKK